MKMIGEFLDERNRPFLFLIFVVAVLGTNQIFLRKKIEANGVYIKSKVLDVQGRKGGIMVTICYDYKGNHYEGTLGAHLGSWAIGKEFFIKLLPYDPDVFDFFEDSPVPDCLSKINAPVEGWKQMPFCK